MISKGETPFNIQFSGNFLIFVTYPHTGVAQLVEHRSPKPSVGRSSRSSRAKSRNIAAFFLLFLHKAFYMTADLFIPCFIDQFYPQTAHSVVRILEYAGVTVRYNPEQTCCGQPAFNSGHWREARGLALKFLHDFSDADTIVSPSASCTAYIRNYYHRLTDHDQKLQEKFSTLKNSIYELSDFLVNILEKDDFGAEFPYRVTWHDACSALREYGIREEPRILLRKVRRLTLAEMADTETCCGFGGTFAAKFHHISGAMTEQKVENALATGAEYIASTEASCLMNMESYIRRKGLPLKTIHLADILAQNI